METQGSGEGYEDPRRIKPSEGQVSRDGPPPPSQRCPRCQSENTKFSYFNNYNASQPRYFCKACRRYWTHGGSLRNVPVGGGNRNNKRRRASSFSSSNNGGAGEGQRARVNVPIQLRPPQNLIGFTNRAFGNQSQLVRAMPPMRNFYPQGGFMSTFASMHSQPNQSPQMIDQVPVNLDGSNFMDSGGRGDDSNMALLQGLDLSAAQVQPQNEAFQRQQFVVQNLVGSATSSAFNNNIWNSPTTNTAPIPSDDGIGSSINPNQFPDNLPGFNPAN